MQYHLNQFEPTHLIFNDALASVMTANMPAISKKTARVEVVHTLEQLPVGPYAGDISGGAKTPAELPLFRDLDGSSKRSVIKLQALLVLCRKQPDEAVTKRL